MREVFRLDARAHEVLVEPARAQPELWRLVAGLGLTAFVFVTLAQMLYGFVASTMGPGDAAVFDLELASGETARAMIYLLVQLGLLLPATGFACVVLHQRGFLSLIGPVRPAIGQFLLVLGALGFLIFVMLLIPPWGFSEEDGITRNMSLTLWLGLLPLSLGALLLQVSAEEVLFRGYLQQQLAARFAHPAIWMAVPSALFALGHYAPETMGENALLIAIWAGVFGMFMADLTARAGTLGPAIAFHLVNNISAILILAPKDDLAGLSLFVTPFGYDDSEAIRIWLAVDLLNMFVFWLAARLVLRR